MLIYTTIITPFRISFYEDDTIEWIIVDTCVDVIFAIDIFFNFISAYFDSDLQIILNRKTIAWNYLKSWFIVDFIAILPVQFMVDTQGKDYASLARLARLPRLYRLIKLTKLN